MPEIVSYIREVRFILPLFLSIVPRVCVDWNVMWSVLCSPPFFSPTLSLSILFPPPAPMHTENTCFNYFYTTKLLPVYTDSVSKALKQAFIKVFIYI